MENLNLDTGLRTFSIAGGGSLRFNPADPNLYGRFLEGSEKLKALEQELTRKGETAQPEEILALMQAADTGIKEILKEIFGGENDFHKALGGISLLAVGSNGKTVAQNLMEALSGVLEDGAKALVDQRLQQAREDL